MNEGDFPVCRELLVKLAMRCNISCTYCYWFRDSQVYEKPAILLDHVRTTLITRIAEHVARHSLPQFRILFHGGEPLLYGKERFREFCRSLRQSEAAGDTKYRLSITTNALVLDREWLEIFRDFSVRVTLSIDGPRQIHDKRRKDFMGRGTHDRVRAAISLLQSHGMSFGTLAVCDPQTDPADLLSHFVCDLNILEFDVLVPDRTHDDEKIPIDKYYVRLFDLWLDEYASRGVEIRYVNSIMRGLLGGYSTSQSIGGGPITTATVLTDGSLEALDTVRIVGNGSTQSRLNVLEHEIQDIHRDPLWQELNQATTQLPLECQTCHVREVCGGGHIASRWSIERRFDNPTIYCQDLKAIIPHVWDRIKGSLYFSRADGTRIESPV